MATEYSDALADVYTQPAATLGRALGLPEHMGGIFAGEGGGEAVFQA